MVVEYGKLGSVRMMNNFHKNNCEDFGMPLPGEIWYHYTDINGLYGILNDGTFYATNYKFLNDKSEISYTFNLLKKILKDNKDLSEDKTYLLTIEKLLDEFELYIDFCTASSTYIISFSENKDSLSLWSNYSNKQGYNIGIDITNTFSLSTESAILPCKVIYDHLKQKKMIVDEIQNLVQNLKNLEFKTNEYIDECFTFFFTNIYLYSMFFKDKLFSCEEECRAIYIDFHNNVDVVYRATRNLIIPYMKITSNMAKTLPVRRITIGPTNHSDIIFESIRAFVKSKKYNLNEDCIKRSDITLRF